MSLIGDGGNSDARTIALLPTPKTAELAVQCPDRALSISVATLVSEIEADTQRSRYVWAAPKDTAVAWLFAATGDWNQLGASVVTSCLLVAATMNLLNTIHARFCSVPKYQLC